MTASQTGRAQADASGRITVDNQPLKLDARYAGKTAIVIIGGTVPRPARQRKTAVKARRHLGPIARLHVKDEGTKIA